MPDKESLFNTLKLGDGTGSALDQSVEGDTAAPKQASAALAFKDPSGALIYPVTNADGEVIVSQESGVIACISDEGSNGGSGAFVDLALIVAALTKVYQKFSFSVSCFRDTVYELVHIDDVGVTDTETLLATFRTNSGSPNEAEQLDCLTFDTTGKTGVQNFVLRGKNINATSTMDAVLAVEEVQ